MTNVNPPWMKIQNDELHMVSVRLPVPLVDAIDKWCKQQGRGRHRPTRSYAIRYALETAFFLREDEND